MFKKTKEWLRELAEAASCHHALYGVLAAGYAGAQLQLLEKGLAGWLTACVYLVLALRG